MTGFVVDCSVALAWCFGDEASAETEKLLDVLKADTGLVPTLWHFEMSSALLQAERRKRVAVSDVTAIWALVDNLPIETDSEPPARKRRDVWSLARQHRLTVYDAVYLELSIRAGLPLATRDADLAGAAESCGVPVLPKKLKRS